MGKLLLIEHALEGRRCWWLSPTYGMSAQVWRDLKALLRPLNPIINESERRIDLPVHGGMIAVRSTHNADRLRGEGLDFAVLDEVAFMAPTVWSEVVRPMLLERRGGAFFLSTPYGRNHFWELFKLGLDPEESEWSSFQASSYDNPLIEPAELDALKRITPERVFKEEYLAQFLEDSGQVFRGVSEATTASNDAHPSQVGRVVMGVDWGRDHDYTAIALIDADTGRMVALERFHHIGYELQRERLKLLVERWQPSAIWAEANSIGTVNIEALQADGLPVRPFQTTARSKAPLIEGLALAIERRELELLNDPVLVGELLGYQMTRLAGGGFRYGAPSGGHDDTVIATALAWHGVKYGGITVDFG